MIHNILVKIKWCHNLIKYQEPLSRGLFKTIERFFQFVYHVIFIIYPKTLRLKYIVFLEKVPIQKVVFTSKWCIPKVKWVTSAIIILKNFTWVWRKSIVKANFFMISETFSKCTGFEAFYSTLGSLLVYTSISNKLAWAFMLLQPDSINLYLTWF